MIEIDFDPPKDAINREKHGIGLPAGAAILNGPHLRQRSTVPNKANEERWRAVGFVEGRLMVCIYTIRGEVYRVISLRAARVRERQEYEEAFQPR